MIPRWDPPWLEKRARATPDVEALAWADGHAITYAELFAAADDAARELRRIGVDPGDVTSVLMSGGPGAVVLIHALQLCGAVLLPLNTRLRDAEIRVQVAESGARFLLHGSERGARLAASVGLAGFEVRVGVKADLAFVSGGQPPGATPPSASSSDGATGAGPPLALLYTSGTTGSPKAAQLSAANFWHSAVASADRLGCEAGDRWLACIPLFHVGGLSIVFRSVLGGTSILVHDGFDAEAVAFDLESGRANLVSLVPTMLARLLAVRGDRECPASVRAILLGGGAAPTALLERARRLGYPLAPTYGLTEACSQVATRVPGDVAPPLDGRLVPLAGVDLRLVDDEGCEVAPEQEGEVLVRGGVVTAGYWKRPDATRDAFSGEWFRTGDVGVLDCEGRLRVLDRRSDLIVSGGENVYPAEVEATLEAHPAVAEAAVVAVVDEAFGARPAACVVAVAGAARDSQALLAHCREALATFKVPVRIEWREALPRTAAGKLRRAQLRAELAR